MTTPTELNKLRLEASNAVADMRSMEAVIAYVREQLADAQAEKLKVLDQYMNLLDDLELFLLDIRSGSYVASTEIYTRLRDIVDDQQP